MCSSAKAVVRRRRLEYEYPGESGCREESLAGDVNIFGRGQHICCIGVTETPHRQVTQSKENSNDYSRCRLERSRKLVGRKENSEDQNLTLASHRMLRSEYHSSRRWRAAYYLSKHSSQVAGDFERRLVDLLVLASLDPKRAQSLLTVPYSRQSRALNSDLLG